MTALLDAPVSLEDSDSLEDSEMDVYELFDELDLPDHVRAEIIDGEIHVSPRPAPAHMDIEYLMARQLEALNVQGERRMLLETEIRHADLDGRYSPDVQVVTLPYRFFENSKSVLDAASTLLAVEITSRSNAEDDRRDGRKWRGYARVGVPVLVLIDRHRGTGHVFSDPADGTYVGEVCVKLGNPLALPAPFDLKLETSAEWAEQPRSK